MPKAQIPPGYAKAEILGSYGPATWANVMYYDASPSDPTHPTDAAAAVNAAVHAFYEIWAPACTSAWQVNTVKVTYRADSSSTYTITIADAIGGTFSDTTEDAQVAYLVNWVSGDSRKGGKPRQYIPGVTASRMQDTARLTNTFITAVNPQIATWLAGFPYSSGTGVCHGLVEMSFVNGKVDRDPPIATPIVMGHLNPVVATQRRRVDRLRV